MTIATRPQRGERYPTLPFVGRDATRHHGLGFWLVAYTFAITMAFSAVPTPLYVLYQRRDHFGSFTLTLVFAAYAVGVVASLFLAGHLSDWIGRRRILVPAVLVNMLAGLVFLAWPAIPGLLIARFVSGVSIGMLTATATAHLTELHLTARPGASRSRADLVATVANLGGIGLGPLVSGLLAQYVSDPLRVPYLVFEVLLLLGALAIGLAPETVERPETPPAYRPQRVVVPAAARSRYIAAATAGMAEFALFGLFTSLAPSILAGTLHQHSHAVAGLAAFIVFGSAAVAQIALARATLTRQLGAGFALMIAGLALVTVAAWLPSLALFLVGGAFAGGGAGVAFKGSVTTVLGLASPQTRGEALAGLFLAAYVGLSVPVLALGLATQLVSARVVLVWFAGVLVAVIAAVGRGLFRTA
jgi:MFS family permease